MWSKQESNPALEHSSCHQCSPKMFFWKLRFVEPAQAKVAHACFRLCGGLNSTFWTTLASACFVSAHLVLIVYRAVRRPEQKWRHFQHCTQLTETEWMKHIPLFCAIEPGWVFLHKDSEQRAFAGIIPWPNSNISLRERARSLLTYFWNQQDGLLLRCFDHLQCSLWLLFPHLPCSFFG